MKSESKPLSTPRFSFFNKRKSSEKHKQSLWTELSLRFPWNKATAAFFTSLSSVVWGPKSQRYLKQEVQSARGEICDTDASVSYRHRGSQVKQKGHGRPQRDHHRRSHRLAAPTLLLASPPPLTCQPCQEGWCWAIAAQPWGSLHLVAAVTELATPTTVHKDNDMITSEWVRRDK